MEDKTDKVKVDAKIEGRTGEIDFNTLKSGGLIKQRQKDMFTVRLRCPGGRVPTACSGCEYNPNGLADTQKMVRLVDEKYFGRDMPHKFKISFSGCPIDCARTNENDLGFQGAVKPEWDEETCTGCRICSKACMEGAIESDIETGKPIYDPEKCLYCADCIRACPTDSWREKIKGGVVRVGGRHGRHPITGHKIAEFISDEDVPNVIETVTKWYGENGALLLKHCAR